MKIRIKRQQLGGLPPAQWLRRAAYVLIYDRQSGQESFARRLSRDFYPRFHLYVQEIEGGELFFNLHLDHKKASYEGQSRHSADYEGEIVEQEAARLRSLLQDFNEPHNQPLPRSVQSDSEVPERTGDVLSTLKPSFVQARAPKRSWWQKLFS